MLAVCSRSWVVNTTCSALPLGASLHAQASVTYVEFYWYVYLECGVRRTRSELTALLDPIVLEVIEISQSCKSYSNGSDGIPCSHG